jgi:hypothetical protein
VRPQTSVKLAIASVIAIFFAGFILRAAVRLASVAMHSLFFAILLVVIVAWIFAKTR